MVGWRFPDAFMSEGDGIGLEEEWQGQGKSVCYLVLTCVRGRGNAVHRTGVGGGKSSAACSLVPSSFHLQTSMSIVNPFHFSFIDKLHGPSSLYCRISTASPFGRNLREHNQSASGCFVRATWRKKLNVPGNLFVYSIGMIF